MYHSLGSKNTFFKRYFPLMYRIKTKLIIYYQSKYYMILLNIYNCNFPKKTFFIRLSAIIRKYSIVVLKKILMSAQ